MTAIALRTPLFVPGDRPERFGKAASAGADAVILDLEDGVAPDAKAKARLAVAWHGITGCPVVVRVNPLEGPLAELDLAALDGTGLTGIMVAKAADPAALAGLGERLPKGVAIIALIETAAGVAAARQLALLPRVTQLAFGSIDLALDLGCEETFEALLAHRSEVVLASRLAGLAAPLDGVTVALDDPERLARDARRARSLGFGGKLLIHPRQIAPVRQAFAPTSAEIAWARGIVEAALRSGEGAIAAHGQMIDAPVLARARRLLDQVA